MDNYSNLVNSILLEHTSILKENQLAEISPRSGQSFGDFLRGLQGKTRKDILDSGSFARLYSMNMHGIGGNKNSPDAPAVLLSKFLTKLGDFVNQDITKLRSGLAETDEFKNKYDYQGHLEREKERRDLFRQSMTEKDPEKKAELRQKKNAFRNNSEYAEARRALHKKEDADVKEYHNRPIEQGELVNDGSEEFMKLQDMYNKIQGIGHAVEDQESSIRSLDGFFSDEEAHIEDNENDMDPEVKKIVNTLELAGKFGSPKDTGKLKKAKKQITNTAARGLKKLDSVLKTNLDQI